MMNPRQCAPQSKAPWWLCALLAACGSPSHGKPADAALDAFLAISAPDDQWTWVDFPDSKCASGTATGMAVNPHSGATELMVFFEGGGECWDATTCWGSSPAASNLAGYDSSTFAHDSVTGLPILDRTFAGNPFASMNLVFVPYCTGDLHAGNALANLSAGNAMTPTYFYGETNIDLFVTRIVPTFDKTTHVWLTGTSAGGSGTFIAFAQLARAFGVRVDIVDDSGPPLLTNGATDNTGVLSTWGYRAPGGCSDCASKFANILAYDLQAQTAYAPPGRYAYLGFEQDPTLATRYEYTLPEYQTVITMFASGLPTTPTAASLLVNATSHVVESNSALEPEYMPWLAQMVADDAGWTNVVYPAP
jgi:hypothetical protein